MGAVTVNGLACASASVTMPRYGPWSADATLHGAVGPASGEAVELAIGRLTLKGTVRRGAAHGGSRSLRIVGGAGGWRKIIPPKHYSHLAGVKKSSVIADAAREVGEVAVVADDRTLGTAYVRDRGRAEQVVKSLSGDAWYVDAAGKTQVRERETGLISSAFTVASRRAGAGLVEIATEAYEDWVPGRSFRAPTVPDDQVVSLVSLRAADDGKVRLSVLAADEDTKERLRDAVRAIVQSEIARLAYAGVWEYRVAFAGDRTLDATSTDPRMPDVKNVPYFPGLHGERVTPPSGAKVLIAFVNADPARPVVVAVKGGATEHLVTVEAMVLFVHNVFAVLGQANGIFIGPLIAAQLSVAINAALAAQGIPAPPPAPPVPVPAAAKLPQQLAAASIAGTMAGGLPGNTVLAYKPLIDSLLLTKQSDVSGLFPGLGVPEQAEGF